MTKTQREKFLKSPIEFQDPHKSAYTRYDELWYEYKCSKCDYRYIDIDEGLVISEGAADCEHELCTHAVLLRTPLEFDDNGRVNEATVKKARDAIKEVLESQRVFKGVLYKDLGIIGPPPHHVRSLYYIKKIVDVEPWAVLRLNDTMIIAKFKTKEEAKIYKTSISEKAKKRIILELPYFTNPIEALRIHYFKYRGQLQSGQFPKNLETLKADYDAEAVRRAVTPDGKKDVVERDSIQATSIKKRQNQFAWCLAISQVVHQNPEVSNIPMIGAFEKYDSRAKKTP